MTDHNFDDEEQMPLWDVALAALVTEKYQNKPGRILSSEKEEI